MYLKMLDTIKKHNLIHKGDKVGAAVSGGIDSMVLLYALKALSEEMGFELVCLHFEHGIRGESSVRDARFVERAASEINVPFYMGTADIPKVAKEKTDNVEATARRLRYEFFERMSSELKLSSVATAHHMGDQAETLLLNLIRGCGMDGLCGMDYKRTPNIIRPLLDVSRREIEIFAHENNIENVEDETNSCIDYSRNYIRHVVLPAMIKLNPAADENIAKTAEIIKTENECINDAVEREFLKAADIKDNCAYIDADCLKKSALKARIIRKAISEISDLHDIEKVHVDALLELAFGQTGKEKHIKHGIFAIKEYDKLVIYKHREPVGVIEEMQLQMPGKTESVFGNIEIEECSNTEKVEASSFIQYANASVLNSAVVRGRRQGDRIVPFGMTGSKKLKDVFIDAKIPKLERDKIPLIANSSEVLWVPGVMLSEKLRVKYDTDRIVKIIYNKGENK